MESVYYREEYEPESRLTVDGVNRGCRDYTNSSVLSNRCKVRETRLTGSSDPVEGSETESGTEGRDL